MPIAGRLLYIDNAFDFRRGASDSSQADATPCDVSLLHL